MARPPAPATQPPAGGPPQASRRGGLLARVGGSRNGAILAAGATVALVALLSVLRGKSSKSDPAPTVTQAGGDGFDSGPYDMWNQWEQQYEELQGRVSTLEHPPAPTPDPLSKAPPAGFRQKPPIATAPPAAQPTPKPPVKVAPAPAPKPAAKTYVVKSGDTLSGIAKKLGISMATLKKLNPVYWTNAKYNNGNKIWAGDKVKYQ